jgi:hypothetical protein
MSFADDIAEVVHELLDPGADTLGEDVVIRRPGAGTYDPTTRKRSIAGTPLEQTLRGTFDDPGLTPASIEGGLSERHDRILYAVPAPTGGFEPKQADEVDGETRSYRVNQTAHVRKQGVDILWVCGLKLA